MVYTCRSWGKDKTCAVISRVILERPRTFKQEVSSKKITVETNKALLSLKKDGEIVKGSKWPEDGIAMTHEGPKCPKNWSQND